MKQKETLASTGEREGGTKIDTEPQGPRVEKAECWPLPRHREEALVSGKSRREAKTALRSQQQSSTHNRGLATEGVGGAASRPLEGSPGFRRGRAAHGAGNTAMQMRASCGKWLLPLASVSGPHLYVPLPPPAQEQREMLRHGGEGLDKAPGGLVA